MNLTVKIISLTFVLFNLQAIYCDWPNFQLFTRTNNQNFLLTTSGSGVSSTPFNFGKKTYFIVHGWNGKPTNDWALKMKDSILTKDDSNVFIVDWEEGANVEYNNAAANVRISGSKIGEFIRSAGIKTSNIHCIGHSLGAHVCGFAGKVTKLARITGLDPAGPLFKEGEAAYRLNKTDADFVDVIHVDGLLGIQTQIGHKDYYPNGGLSQPGCFFIGKRDIEVYYIDPTNRDVFDLVSCSHLRVNQFFIESVTSTCKFTSIKCDSYDNYNKGKCKCSTTYGCSSMGYNAISNKEEGKFYLNTNSKSPYCKE